MVEGSEEHRKILSMMLFSGPYGSQDADHMCRIGRKAIDMGYRVQIFLYGDGVHAQLSGQNPKVFMNIGDELKKLVERGAEIKSCVRCSQARGYVDGEFDEENDRYPSGKSMDEVKIYSLYGFINMIQNADKLITFGSG